MGELLCVLLLFAASLTAGSTTSADAQSSFLELSAGLDLRMSHSYQSSGYPIPLAMFTVAIPTLHEAGLFFPILSSPNFNTTTKSSSDRSFGFSLGFYFLPLLSAADIYFPCDGGCNIYMAVCAGSSGRNLSYIAEIRTSNGSAPASLQSLKTLDGFAAPVWIANLDSPITYADKASLIVELVADSKGSTTLELQLRDGENVVWQVGNVGSMEINQDSGNLLIYDSPNRTHVVWQSSRTDSIVALAEGQSLLPGMALVSNDSTYVATMEKGGLVFYMNKTHFNMELQPTPYWLFPVNNDDPKSVHSNINQLISSAPCASSAAHADAIIPRHDIETSGLGAIALYPGSCSSRQSYIQVSLDGMQPSWTFWSLETDGNIYFYTVLSPSGYVASVTRNQLGLDASYNTRYRVPFTPPFLEWQECNVPMACGPLGVCTPGAIDLCSCSAPDFEPINLTNFFQGCKCHIKLPNCSFGNGYAGSIDYVQLDSTASILLLNGWTFNSTHTQVIACKEQCSFDCSCNGFFYQKTTSSCFFIIDAISLMVLVDKNLTFVDYSGKQDPPSTYEVLARDYATFLKVTSKGRLSKQKKIPSRFVLIALLLSAVIPSIVVVCLVFAMLARYLFRARRKKYVHSSMLAEEEKELEDILPLLPIRFSYKGLFEATEGFSKLLGVGGYGSVYAGVLSDGRKVAVKVLHVVLQGTGHSKQFLAEIATIGHTSHHNVVRLVGFCWEVSQCLLVYEYVERGSLDHWIFERESAVLMNDTSTVVASPLLDWRTRYNVALGIARGLTYLHEDCEQPILHFDIKPQNILLDNNFVAKLHDFGMSRLVNRDMLAIMMTGMRDTLGYIAPEWCTQGTGSEKSDMYSMGMVLLEIVAGRKNLDFSLLNSSLERVEQEAWHFPSWAARKCEQGLMMELIDRRLHVCGYDTAQAIKIIHTAFWCIQEDPAMRPNAPTVMQWLEGSSLVEEPPFSLAGRQLSRRETLLSSLKMSRY